MEEKYKSENSMNFEKYIQKITETKYNVYIVGDIVEDFTKYIDLVQLLSKSNLEITFIIKTMGGDLYSSLTLHDMIKRSKCKTIADVYTARSGGSLIMLACNEIKLNKFSTVMIHEPQFNYNKNNLSQVREYVNYIDNIWFETLKVYKKFDGKIIQKLETCKEVFYTTNELKALLG